MYVARVCAHVAQHSHGVLGHGIASRRGFIVFQHLAAVGLSGEVLSGEHTVKSVLQFHLVR